MEQRYSGERPFWVCPCVVSNGDAVTSHECVKACVLRMQCCFLFYFKGSARSWSACGCLHLQFETQLGEADRELSTFLFLVIPLRKPALLCLMQEEAIAKVHILIRKGSTVTFEAQKKVLLKKASPRNLIQPSKALYKPGEIGKHKSFTRIWNSFPSWHGVFQNWVSGGESKHCMSGQLKQSSLPGVQIL